MSVPTTETYTPLLDAYNFLNDRLFEGRLPGALITLQRKKRTLGYFSKRRFASRAPTDTTSGPVEHADEISLNPAYFGLTPIESVLSTLAHEAVHQWQHHFGETKGRGRYHNSEWAKKMIEIGLYPTSTGKPGGQKTGDHVTHVIVADGVFDRVCQELLNGDFKLAWYDRYLPAEAIAVAKEIGPRKFTLEELESPGTAPSTPAANDDESTGGVGVLTLEGEDSEEGIEREDDTEGGGVAAARERDVHGEEEGERPLSSAHTDITPRDEDLPHTQEGTSQAAGVDSQTKKLDIEIMPAPKKSSKVKYTCPKCKTNVWGKAGIAVICGVDQLQFEEFC